MQRVEGHGYVIEYTPDGGGRAIVTVKTALSLSDQAAGAWLPEVEWRRYEAIGEDAFETALMQALDDLWPDRY